MTPGCPRSSPSRRQRIELRQQTVICIDEASRHPPGDGHYCFFGRLIELFAGISFRRNRFVSSLEQSLSKGIGEG